MKIRNQHPLFLLLTLVMLLQQIGCATYQSKVSQARQEIQSGQASAAIERLKPLAQAPGDDQLIYLLDYATALQIAGRYRESNQAFIQADKLTELMDYHSVSNVVGAALGGEEMIQYKGDSFEKFMINTMLAINFLSLGENDSALVECRRINEKIQKMRMDEKKSFEFSPFAKYLSALIWESNQRWDDAAIGFEEAYRLDSTNPYLPADLIRSNETARRPEAALRWKSSYPDLESPLLKPPKNSGELVIIYQQGWGPRKASRNDSYRFPKLVPVFSETNRAELIIDNKETFRSERIYNIEQVAIQTLEEDYGSLVARRMGSVVAKEVVADRIKREDPLLGAVAQIAMYASDRADLRQWSTLPQTIQMIRVPLNPGRYRIRLQGLDRGGSKTADQFEIGEIEVRPRRKTFVNWRSLK